VRAGLIAAAAAAVAAAAAAPAHASFDACTYDAGSHTATASMLTPGAARLSVGAGGEILADEAPCGAATAANTDEIVAAGSPGTDEITVDLSGPGGPFAKPGGDDELHIYVDLGSEGCECALGRQFVRVLGTDGDDQITAGAGFLVNFDAGADADSDLAVNGADVHGLRIDAGEGDDTVSGRGGSGTGLDPAPVQMSGGPGDDRLALGERFSAALPGAGNDTVLATATHGEVAGYTDMPAGVSVDMDVGEVVDAYGGLDHLSLDLDAVTGSEHGDTMHAGWGIPLYGEGGDDRIVGDDGDDWLSGGAGNDLLDANGSFDGDSLDGGPGRDMLRGSGKGDYLDGGPDHDHLDGHGGGDRLIGGAGDDYAAGGRGPDVYEFDAPVGRELDTIFEADREGKDTLDLGWFTRVPTPLTIDLSSRTTALAVRGHRRVRGEFPATARFLENVVATSAGDRIVGNGRRNEIHTGGGDDTIDCRGARDTLFDVSSGDRARAKNCEIVN
jgi:Ca2+-binding RTX toxin-like protein